MPKLKLTKTNIDKLPYADKGKVIVYFDTELKGFGLRVGEESKTFFVQVDLKSATFDINRQYKTVKSTIGRYGELTPEQARKEAGEKLRQLKIDGIQTETDKPTTLKELYKRYVKDKKLRQNTANAYKVYFETGGAKFTTWMDVPITKLIPMLTPDVVISRYTDILNKSGKGAASNAFKMLQAIINYGMILYPHHIPKNPVKVISDANLWPEIKARTTCIEPDQFKQFHDAILSFSAIHRDCYMFALYQGLRPDEAHSLRWEDVNLEKKLFDLTWKDSETKHRGVLPLSRQSMEILERRKAVRLNTNIWVFPSETNRSKNGHITLRADKLGKKTGLDITPHSLRRTFTTVGERLKLRRNDINKLTNHIDQSITGKHYDQTGVEDLRAPLQAICNEIERLMVNGVGAKVIEFPSKMAENRI
jgi:integrase